MKKKYRFPQNYSLTKTVLDILIDFSERSTLFETPYHHIKRLNRELSGAPEPQWWRYNRAVEYLAQREQIKLINKNDRLFIKLTQKGKLRGLLARLNRDFQTKPKWDGKWRVIIWDIPEESKQQRNRIRALVKNLGFYQLQKSVFITPYPLPSSAVAFLKESDLLQYIRFMRVDKFDNDRSLKKHFNLS